MMLATPNMMNNEHGMGLKKIIVTSSVLCGDEEIYHMFDITI